jgi:hypothetical protein
LGYTIFHARNNLAARHLPVKYFIAAVYRANFTETWVADLDQYIAKVIYINLPPDDTLLGFLANLRIPGIVIFSNQKDAVTARSRGLDALAFKEATPGRLNEKIANRFHLTPKQLDQLGFTGDPRPCKTVSENPEAYDFTESGLPTHPYSNTLLLLPNELLINDMRKRYPPSDTPLDPDQRLSTLIETAHTIATQKLIDFWLADPNASQEDISTDIRDSLNQYSAARDAASFTRLLEVTQPQTNTYVGPHDFILCCPSLNKTNIDSTLRSLVPDRVRKYFYRAKTGDYLTWIKSADLADPSDRISLQALIHFQTLENDYLSCILGLYSLTGRRSVVRTPQLPSTLFSKLRQIRSLDSDRNKASFVKGINAIATDLTSSIPSEIMEYITLTKSRHIKLISDLPLEWIQVNNVPLLYQKDLSRLPITPGNGLFGHYAVVGSPLRLTADAIKILILNCAEPGDHIYRFPKYLHDQVAKHGLQLEYAEPATLAEYWDRIATFLPTILVHWGHGSYTKNDNQGYLHIRGERTPIWGTTDVAIPPIVMIAACETAAMAETHNTPSNGWLSLGARAVLATYFPVYPDLTLVLFARMFANLSAALFDKDPLSTWSEIVSKTLALNRYLDFLYAYQRWGLKKGVAFSPSEFGPEYTYRYNREHLPPAEGYRQCMRIMHETMEYFGKTHAEAFASYMKNIPTIPHTMFFTNMGSPESIHIVKAEKQDTSDNPAETYWKRRRTEDGKT